MQRPFRHLSNRDLLSSLDRAEAEHRANTAQLLSYLGEIEHRQIHVKAGYASIEAYCIHELNMDEEDVPLSVCTARVARQYPVIFPMLADGRLGVWGVARLAPHLTPETVDDLLAAAAGKSEPEFDQLMAERFPESHHEASPK